MAVADVSIQKACPYKGLVPYSEDDYAFFFGRERETAIIIANLLASRLTIVYGNSGAGKSSVLAAGVAHQLRQNTLQNLSRKGKAGSLVVIFKSWREDAITSLKNRIIESATKQKVGELPPNLSEHSLSEVLKTISEKIGGNILLILDQFEQYFLWHPYDDPDDKFAREFLEALNTADLRANFLISIREEWYAQLDRFKGRIPNLYDNYLRIRFLDRNSSRVAIEKPLESYNINVLKEQTSKYFTIESSLVDQILDELESRLEPQSALGEGKPKILEIESRISTSEPSIQPAYLQMVMTRIWNEEVSSNSNVLRKQTLEKLGGVQKIIKTHLDIVMKNFSSEECQICSEMFRYLVTPSGVKVAHTVSDLASYACIDKEQMTPVIVKLCSEEILREIPPSSRVNENRYEIYHDILGRAILDWQARFKKYQEWLGSRPWGYARVLTTGNILELKGLQVSFGRWWPNGLAEFESQYISRMHMLLARDEEKRAYVLDLRSKNGTTVNAEYVSYGREREVRDGDIVVLAGTVPFQVWMASYNDDEKFRIQQSLPLNAKDKNQASTPSGWAVLINGTTRQYEYIRSDVSYLSRVSTGDICVSEKTEIEPFLILKRHSNGKQTFEYCDEKHELHCLYKVPGTDDPEKATISFGQVTGIGGIYTFNYRNITFQIIPL